MKEGLIVIDNDISNTQRTIDNTQIGAALREAQENMLTPEKDREKIGKTKEYQIPHEKQGTTKVSLNQ